MARVATDFANGLDDAFGATFTRLTRVFQSRGLSPDDSADLAQETVVRTLSHVERHGRRRDDLTPLVNTVAKNLLAEHFRTNGRELAAPLEAFASEHDVVDEIVRSDHSRRVREAIAKLPERQRRAMSLVLDGISPADIATELGMKRNALDVLLHRTRKFLAQRLQDCRESAWGSGAILAARLRHGARRLASFCHAADPAALAPMIVSLGALLIMSGSPGTTEPSTRGPAIVRTVDATMYRPRTVSRSASDAQTHKAVDSASTRSGSTVPPAGFRVDVRDHKGSLVLKPTNPLTGERVPIGAGFWHERNPSDPGITGPLLTHLTDATCDRFPDLCEEE